MARGVLGNDPFKRGAAVREEPVQPGTETTPSSPPREEPKKPSPPAQAKTASAQVQSDSKSKKSGARTKGQTTPAGSDARSTVKDAAKPSAPSSPPRGAGSASSTKPSAAKAPSASAEAQAKRPAPDATSLKKGAVAAAAKSKQTEPKASDAEGQEASTRQARTQPAPAEDANASAKTYAAAETDDTPVSLDAPSEARVEVTPSEATSANAAASMAASRGTGRSDSVSEVTGAPPSSTTATVAEAVVDPDPEPAYRSRARTSPGAAEVDGVITATMESQTIGPGPTLGRRAINALVLGRSMVEQASTSAALGTVLGAAGGLLHALRTGLGTAGATQLDAYGKDPELTQRLDVWSRFLYERYWRVQVEGADRIPTGPTLLVANHSGAVPIDGPVLHAALMRERADLREPRWLVEDQVFHAPFFGTLLNRLGAVRACPENALRLLGEQRPVIVFPEGFQGISKPFSERYRLMRFGRGGFVKIALRARVSIVPVAIVGAEEAMPLVARLPGRSLGLPYLPLTSPVPLPSKWTIRFGEPIDISEHPAEAAEDLVLVHRLNERTRDAIQGMLESMLKARTGVFA